ncbi:MAG: hypothetical protein K8W52_46265 [Deltaproteobacteria bacterium]|nr:hypothetical protein [Deltaproteobacteria bacterium]
MNDDVPDDPIDDAFAARLRDQLVAVDLDAVTAARIRRLAHAALAGGPVRPRWRWVEATVGATLAAAQLVWAVSAVLGMYR